MWPGMLPGTLTSVTAISIRKLQTSTKTVSSSLLMPGTTYEVVAQIWNNSIDAPVVGMPVAFSFLEFGVGTTSVPIGNDATAPTTLESQNLPQNQWRIHPVIDGCEPVVIVYSWLESPRRRDSRETSLRKPDRRNFEPGLVTDV